MVHVYLFVSLALYFRPHLTPPPSKCDFLHQFHPITYETTWKLEMILVCGHTHMDMLMSATHHIQNRPRYGTLRTESLDFILITSFRVLKLRWIGGLGVTYARTFALFRAASMTGSPSIAGKPSASNRTPDPDLSFSLNPCINTKTHKKRNKFSFQLSTATLLELRITKARQKSKNARNIPCLPEGLLVGVGGINQVRLVAFYEKEAEWVPF